MAEKAEVLAQEFFGHLTDARMEDPRMNERDVFEAWATQQLANLGVLIDDLNERVNLIASHTRKR
jgi:hypothetical protein